MASRPALVSPLCFGEDCGRYLRRPLHFSPPSYYSKKQRTLRLSSGCKSQGPSRSHGSTPHAQAGLTFFCQATRLSGLTYTELVRSLHRLHKAGAPLCGAVGVLREGVLTQDRPSFSSYGLPRPRCAQPLLSDS